MVKCNRIQKMGMVHLTHARLVISPPTFYPKQYPKQIGAYSVVVEDNRCLNLAIAYRIVHANQIYP